MSRGDGRFVVALDASPDARAAFEAACELARRRGAAVTCVFVEDEDALELAAHPHARFVTRSGSQPASAVRDDMERSMRRMGGRVAALVREAASKHQVEATLRTTRGRVVDSLLASSNDADLVLVGKGRRGPLDDRSPTPSVTMRATRSVLLLGAGETLGAPLALVDDPSEMRAVVAAASRLADASGVRLVLVGELSTTVTWLELARRSLVDAGVRGVVEAAPMNAALDALAHARGRTLVVGAGAWSRGVFDAAVDRLKLPVLVAR